MRQLRAAICVFLILTVLTGLAYPALVTGLAQALFNHQANGSVIEHQGKRVGSALLGQVFDAPEYFWSRPSYVNYNGAGSGGANYGPTNPAQFDLVKKRLATLREAHPDQTGPAPIDLVTASASGLDPHISRAAAEYQVTRVARARKLPVDAVRDMVARHTEGRTLGVLGEPRVNVLLLNLALDAARR